MIKVSQVEGGSRVGRRVNAVALQSAVLCAECDVVSDSPHDTCLVCGSRSLLNIARIFGENLPQERASLIIREPLQVVQREIVLTFPKPARLRTEPLAITNAEKAVRDNGTDEAHRGVLFGPKSR